MDAFELLKADHQKVAKLFDLLESARGKSKLEVFRRIKSELELHTHIEETIFYPALEKPEETHDLTLEAYEEHKVVKNLLAELAEAKSANDEWEAQAKVLRENVEHHVDEEENELFDKANDALSDEEIEALGDRMAAEKARKEGQAVPKVATKRASNKPAEKTGIISKIVNFVGLGSGSAPKPAKKAPAKKKSATAKTATKSSKTTRASASKRASASTGLKRMPNSKSAGSKKGRSRSAGKKAAKKRAGRK